MWLSQVVEYYRRFGKEVLEQLYRFSLMRLFRCRLAISTGAGLAYVGWHEFTAGSFYSPSLEDWLFALLTMLSLWVTLAILITPVALDTEKRIDLASKQLEVRQLESICNEFSSSLWRERKQKGPETLL